MKSARVFRLACVVVLLLKPVAFAQNAKPLTNDDVTEMVGTPETVPPEVSHTPRQERVGATRWR